LRQIGHAFGQLHVTALIIERIRKKDWIKCIKDKFNIDVKHEPKLIFGVAFHASISDDVSAKRIIYSFARDFAGYKIYFVKDRNNMSVITNKKIR